MKKTLYIARHATAGYGTFSGDFDRELTPEGITETARMGKLLKDRGTTIDYLCCSSAMRASQTAKVMAEQLGFDNDQIVFSQDLYDDGPKAYLKAVNNIPPSAETAMIIGHNPDVSYFSEYLSNANIGSMNTGSVVKIEFEGLAWNEILDRCGIFVSYDEPT